MKTKHWVIAAIGIAFAIYILFQARFLILGPQVWIESPRDGAVAEAPAITISGEARNAAWISLNGRQIFTDEEGQWEETLIVSKGLSIMTVAVKDRFGRERRESVRIILN
jgi:hypothetical protein